MKLGLLGGTFDPIHSGHLHMARVAERALKLDRIFFITARQPWQKPAVGAGYADRFAMVALALAGKPRWQPLDIAPRPRDSASYTVDELAWLQRRYPRARIFLILGADAFSGIAGWKHYRRLLSQCDCVVFGREGYDFARFTAALDPSLVRAIGRDKIILRTGRAAVWLPRFRDRASSSGIRGLLRSGRPVPPGRLPLAVRQYLLRAQLYRKTA